MAAFGSGKSSYNLLMFAFSGAPFDVFDCSRIESSALAALLTKSRAPLTVLSGMCGE